MFLPFGPFKNKVTIYQSSYLRLCTMATHQREKKLKKLCWSQVEISHSKKGKYKSSVDKKI